MTADASLLADGRFNEPAVGDDRVWSAVQLGTKHVLEVRCGIIGGALNDLHATLCGVYCRAFHRLAHDVHEDASR